MDLKQTKEWTADDEKKRMQRFEEAIPMGQPFKAKPNRRYVSQEPYIYVYEYRDETPEEKAERLEMELSNLRLEPRIVWPAPPYEDGSFKCLSWGFAIGLLFGGGIAAGVIFSFFA